MSQELIILTVILLSLAYPVFALEASIPMEVITYGNITTEEDCLREYITLINDCPKVTPLNERLTCNIGLQNNLQQYLYINKNLHIVLKAFSLRPGENEFTEADQKHIIIPFNLSGDYYKVDPKGGWNSTVYFGRIDYPGDWRYQINLLCEGKWSNTLDSISSSFESVSKSFYETYIMQQELYRIQQINLDLIKKGQENDLWIALSGFIIGLVSALIVQRHIQRRGWKRKDLTRKAQVYKQLYVMLSIGLNRYNAVYNTSQNKLFLFYPVEVHELEDTIKKNSHYLSKEIVDIWLKDVVKKDRYLLTGRGKKLKGVITVDFQKMFRIVDKEYRNISLTLG